jgi:cysteine-rich repeat protein
MPTLHSHRSGFSLVELLLFSGIVAIMAGAIVGFSLVSSSITSSTEVIAEVEQSGQQILHRIVKAIEESDAVVYPPAGETADGVLLLRAEGSAIVETYIHPFQGYARIMQLTDGALDDVSYLSTTSVDASRMIFLHSNQGGTASVSFGFYAENRAVGTEVATGQYGRVFRGTAALRNASTLPTCQPTCGAPPNECSTVADCVPNAPTCNASTCRIEIPVCAGGECLVQDGGPCEECSWCGDADLEGEEECDDACIFPGFPPGCDDGTTINPIDGGDGNDACTRACTIAYCGDGVINVLEEECDDGNNSNGDGCDSECKSEVICRTKSLRVALVFDLSKQKGQSLSNSRAAAKKFIDYMILDTDPEAAKDMAAIIEVRNTAIVVQSLTSTEANLDNAISGFSSPSGNMNLSQGILEADALLNGADGNINAILIFASAGPNRHGAIGENSCDWGDWTLANNECDVTTPAAAARAEGIKIYVVNYSGAEEAAAMLREAANDPDSEYYMHRPNPNDVADVYHDLTDATGLCTCGDGIPNFGEQCDDGNDNNWDTCTNDCTNFACGDGIVRIGFEQCDDANGNDADACKNDCTFNMAVTCGNGVVQGLERCDDGNTVSGDGCSGTESGTPANYCQPEIYVPPFCHTNNELCFVDNDCGEPDPVTCAECANGMCVAVPPLAACGNGTVESPETCDDGCLAGVPNVCEPVDDGDGCSATCTTELVCSSPNACSNSKCGTTGSTWDFTISGIGNSACGTADCGNLNGAITLDVNTFPYCTTNCEWCWVGGSGACGYAIGYRLIYDSMYNRWELSDAALTGTVYITNDSDWNCSAPNTMDLFYTSSDCTGWPETITVTPSGSRTCTSSVCGNNIVEGTETCDDGCTSPGEPSACDAAPLDNGDGCSVTCQVETQCNDSVDNDGIGGIDCADTDCLSTTDFYQHQFPSSVGAINSQVVVDLDQDGSLDIVAATKIFLSNTQIFWHENDGAMPPIVGTEHQVTFSDWGSPQIIGVDAADFDKDGDIDILSSNSNGCVYWHEDTSGNQSFTNNHRCVSSQCSIPSCAYGGRTVHAIDLNQDGEMDILTADDANDKITWWKNDGSETFDTESYIGPVLSGLNDAIPVKIDGDNNIDVVAIYGGKVTWFKSDGANPPGFTQQAPDLDTTLSSGYSLFAADLDNDGDNDIIAGDSAGKMRWYRNTAGSFTAYDIDTSLGGSSVILAIVAGDIDGDNDNDIAIAYQYPVFQGKLSWYQNDGSNPPNFGSEKVISSSLNQFVTLGDIDGDGKLNVVAGEGSSNVWYGYIETGQCNILDDDESS